MIEAHPAGVTHPPEPDTRLETWGLGLVVGERGIHVGIEMARERAGQGVHVLVGIYRPSSSIRPTRSTKSS